MEAFKGVTGQYSSKRIFGGVYLIMALVFIILDQLFEKDIEFEVVVLVVSAGASLLGISLAEYFSKK